MAVTPQTWPLMAEHPQGRGKCLQDREQSTFLAATWRWVQGYLQVEQWEKCEGAELVMAEDQMYPKSNPL